jgi:hypothetical protein
MWAEFLADSLSGLLAVWAEFQSGLYGLCASGAINQGAINLGAAVISRRATADGRRESISRRPDGSSRARRTKRQGIDLGTGAAGRGERRDRGGEAASDLGRRPQGLGAKRHDGSGKFLDCWAWATRRYATGLRKIGGPSKSGALFGRSLCTRPSTGLYKKELV